MRFEPAGTGMSDVQHFVNGKAISGASGRWGDVFNPATGERVRRVALASVAEVDQAVRAARAAFPAWAATAPLTRARVMFKFLEILAREHDALARTIS
jgi:malonate-semialdehyde dehydrogenase (acetylating)/methylmalonate-semialdehyde dehydrogenase